MGVVVLGHNQYGKAENRVVRVFLDRDPHELVDHNVSEVRFSAPNKHHFAYDLARFGLDNAGEVFHADDRPSGLIEATVRRDDAPDPGQAFDPGQGW